MSDNLNYDLDELPFTTALFNYLEDVRPGLQWSTLMCLIWEISSRIVRGRAGLICGPKGCGKGDSMKAAHGLYPTQIHPMYSDEMTNSGVIAYIQKYKLQDKSIGCMLDDLSMVADKWEKMYDTINVANKLISDKKIGLTNREIWKIKKEKGKELPLPESKVHSFSFIAGCTPELMLRVRGFEAYKTMWKDRLTEFFLYITAREQRRILTLFANNPDAEELPIETVQQRIKELISEYGGTEEIPLKAYPVDKSAKPYYESVRDWLYIGKHDTKRASKYFKGDLTAHAWLNGRKTITESDLAVFSLFYPNLFLTRSGSNIQSMVFYTIRDGGKLDRLAKEMDCSTKDLSDYHRTQNYQYSYNSNPLLLTGTLQGNHKNRVDRRRFILKEIKPEREYTTGYPPFKNFINWQEDLIRKSVRRYRNEDGYNEWERINGVGSLWE